MAEATVVGTIQLEIVEDGLKAVASYFPDPEGITWDAQKLRGLLTQEGVISGFDPASMEGVLTQFATAGKEPVTFTVAEGTPVELPRPEEVTWEEILIPDELADDAAAAFLAANPPEIYLTRTETVKTEKNVRIKPKLPFLKPKQEKKIVSEKREYRERVTVDPEVVSKGWAEAGTLIASVARAESGIPGKSVRGVPIPPPPLPEPSVYAGEGLDYAKGEIRAAETGFVRRGANWVDIVGFHIHSWEVTCSKDRATFFLSFSPGDEGAKLPDAESVLAAAEKMGTTRDDLIAAEAIAAAIETTAAKNEPLSEFVISTDSDGSMSIDVSEDGMAGTITIRKGTGKGKKLSLKEIGNAITSSGFTGMGIPQIREDILAFHRGPDLTLKAYPLASGTPPESGEEGGFEFSVEFMAEEEVATLAENDKISGPRAYAGVESLKEFSAEVSTKRVRVASDVKVAEITPGVKGKAGKDVYGKVVEAEAPAEVLVKPLEGIELVGETLISQIDGILEVAELDDALLMRVRPYEDGTISVSISPDRLQAEVTVKASVGSGKPVTVEMVNDAISVAGVTHGLDETAIKASVERAVEKGSVSGVVVAKGTEPIPGKAAEVNFKVHLASGKRVTVEEDGHADFRHQDRITYVKEEQLIAEMLPPTEPVDGVDVAGNPVSAANSTADEAIVTEHLERKENASGVTEIYSKVNGALTYRDGVIDVTRVLEIDKDVDMDVGNVRFAGMIHVSGNVLSGFHLFSEEGIFIDGSLDASLLSAGKDVTIGQGIKGAGKGAVRTKGNIEANFAERATLLAVGDIILNRACLGCSVKANGRLVLEGDGGRLVGGVVRAKHGLDVETVGSPGGARTSVSFGQDYLIGDRIAVEELKINELTEQDKKLDLITASLEKQGKTEELSAFRKKKHAAKAEIEARKRRLFGLRELFERDHDAEVRIRGTLYPGLRLESHGRTKEITTEHRDITFVFDKTTGRIIDKDGVT